MSRKRKLIAKRVDRAHKMCACARNLNIPRLNTAKCNRVDERKCYFIIMIQQYSVFYLDDGGTAARSTRKTILIINEIGVCVRVCGAAHCDTHTHSR